MDSPEEAPVRVRSTAITLPPRTVIRYTSSASRPRAEAHASLTVTWTSPAQCHGEEELIAAADLTVVDQLSSNFALDRFKGSFTFIVFRPTT